MTMRMAVVIPCKNEANNLKLVVDKLRAIEPAVIVVGLDPTTSDDTRQVALSLGCIVVTAKRSGYDPTVSAATLHIIDNEQCDSILYTDAGNKYNYDKVETMLSLVSKGCDMVLAVRIDAAKTMLWHQKLGTKMVLCIINTMMKSNIHDISPFRLVHTSVFKTVLMDPKKYRWPSELLVKALADGRIIKEVSVASLPRYGHSKVSGSLKNSIRAGIEMLSSIKFINYKTESTYATEKE